MEDDDVLAGVPEDAAVAGADDSVLAIDEDEMAQEAREEALAERAAEEAESRRARMAAGGPPEEEGMTMVDEDGAGAEDKSGFKKFSGKRPIIQHSWPAGLQPGIDPNSAEEIAKREARAAKFGMPAPAAPEVSEEERAKREARAAKFGLVASVSAAEKAAEALVAPTPMVAPEEVPLLTAEEVLQRQERARKWGTQPSNPLESIISAAPKGAFWEKRRDADADEETRPEAVYVFGVDKMSTEDLLRFWIADGVTPPEHVEWINDSAATVVFGAAEAAAHAVQARTVPLMPGQEGVDQLSWRTLPLHLAAAGKGLQLVFRLATAKDVKPPKRAASRWYGEVSKKGQAIGKPGKASGHHDKREARKQAANPYGGKRGGTLASKLRDANQREAGGGGDLRARLGSKQSAPKQELGDDLRARIAARAGATEGAGFSYADFKRKRSEKAVGEEDDEMADTDQGGGGGGGGGDTVGETPSALGEVAEPPSGSSVGAPVAPAEGGEAVGGGMDVES